MEDALASGSVADRVRPLVERLLGRRALPVAIRVWDGSVIGPVAAAATIVVSSPRALRRLLYAPNELGFGRAFVAGEIDVEGDLFTALSLRDALADEQAHEEDRADIELGWRGWLDAVKAAKELGAFGPPLPPPPEEARLLGRRHSRARDAAAIAHHYDVGNDFYALFLGSTMTYSCAYFREERMTLDEAQLAKYDLIATKLGLEPGQRLLDVGCGWGGMVIRAAQEFGVRAVGVTLSREQADLARKRVADAGVGDRVEIRVQDYRDIDDGPYDAISSIGMFEHVGLEQLGEYFGSLAGLVRPHGRVLNHGISRPPGSPRFARTSFIDRFVFPDGEVHEVGTVVSAMQAQGLEVRDVHSLREHYARTLRCWVAGLEANWDAAVRLAGTARARVWRLYMAASATNFEAGRSSLHQVLAVRPDERGASAMPAVRPA